MILSLIAAIGKNNELGKDNTLLWNLPVDMKYFRDTTRGHTVIMGRKTFESIGFPLPNRLNIIITRDPSYSALGTVTMNGLDEAIESLNNSNDETFIIGGAEIYKQAILKADKLYITHVDGEFPGADTFFPAIDLAIWHKTKTESFTKDSSNAYDMEFAVYEKV